MAKANHNLISALRNTAEHLKSSSHYQWGHMGSCNCGYLAQEVAKMSKHEIHARAMQRHGDWNEQLNDYCPTSGMLIDDLISELLRHGLDVDDLKNLEKLSDQKILQALPGGKRHLVHNNKADVIEYLNTWADLLEADSINITDLLLENTSDTEKNHKIFEIEQ